MQNNLNPELSERQMFGKYNIYFKPLMENVCRSGSTIHTCVFETTIQGTALKRISEYINRDLYKRAIIDIWPMICR